MFRKIWRWLRGIPSDETPEPSPESTEVEQTDSSEHDPQSLQAMIQAQQAARAQEEEQRQALLSYYGISYIPLQVSGDDLNVDIGYSISEEVMNIGPHWQISSNENHLEFRYLGRIVCTLRAERDPGLQVFPVEAPREAEEGPGTGIPLDRFEDLDLE